MDNSPGGKEILDKAAKAAQITSGTKILDVGCGDGTSLAYLCVKYGVQGTGIDSSSEMIDRAKQIHGEIDGKIDFSVGEADFLDFDSLSFDVVLLQCVLSLVKMRVEALHEAWCVLEGGGKLIVMDVGGYDEASINPKILRGECRTLGFECIHFEDCTKYLTDFAAQSILDGNQSVLPSKEDRGKYGYFLAVFEKQTPVA